MNHGERHPGASWAWLLFITVAAACGLVFSEWLFFATKPSFMDLLGIGARLGILVRALVLAALMTSAALLPLELVGLALRSRGRRIVLLAGCLVPATIGAAVTLMLLDNFTLTVFGFGVRSADGPWAKGGYVVGVMGLVAALLHRCSRAVLREASALPGWALWIARAAPFAALVILAIASTLPAPGSIAVVDGSASRRPNIVLLSGDGIDATHLSLYGYERRTTPVLSQLSRFSMVAENNFPNSAHTGGSIASILTGRLPTQTRVIYPPDILGGQDSYRHLPGLLKSLGYHTIGITIRHYADAYDLNLRLGFDECNLRREGDRPGLAQIDRVAGAQTGYLVQQIGQRLSDRVLYLFAGRDMDEAYEEAAGSPMTTQQRDVQRVGSFLEFLDEEELPFFAHIHLMTTHGRTFPVRKSVFSAGQLQSGPWMIDFYDDAILSVDAMVSRIGQELEKRQLFDDTIFVFHSDHGFAFENRNRTPLLIRFPEGEHSGRIRANTSNIDIAPTLLDYLGVEKPEWMAGRSLLRLSSGEDPPIFSVSRGDVKTTRQGGFWEIDRSQVEPPFYSLGALTMVVCQRSYRLFLDTGRMVIRDVDGHTWPCAQEVLPTPQRAFDMMLEHLSSNGYDVSGLRGRLQVSQESTTHPPE